ncbi:ketopantoate reductase family protein [Alteribacillus bidgolensis]|uniref:2-dehydropantoate 2-reductase n=1 Tax=Alteribacillus bidgolensis TaxID=930129 RepID=A0A1G8L5U9_9BACI|nr:2-dehydropantoate 2-reductase [Alteribacillus bidgolensis]SDI51069.1 ketopantoate reductase [Alteribacillus bidgolensis]
MHIAVYGAGALGIYFGGRFLEAGNDVSFFVREKRAVQLRCEGLKINSIQGDFEKQDITIHTDPKTVEKADIIILAIKGYHLEQALPQIKEISERTNAFILPLLNGVEHIHILQEALGKEKVIGGIAFIIATLDAKGHFEHTSKQHDILFGPLHEKQQDICEKLEIESEKINANSYKKKDILTHIWKKYMFITAFSGITSAAQRTIGDIIETRASFKTAENVLKEMKTLANREGISLTDNDIVQAANQLQSFPEQATSSMHQDLRKGLPLEVEHLHGGALRIAAKHNEIVPVIATLYGIIKTHENGIP